MVQSFLAMWAGGMDERLLRALSPFYLFSLGTVVAFLLAELGAGRFRWLLAAILLTIPKVLEQASNGYADLPVTCGMTVCLALLALAWRGANVGWAVGLAGGLAAIHKDEGLIWSAAAILLMAVWAWRKRVRWSHVAVAVLLLAVLAGPWKSVTGSLGLKPNDYSTNIPRLAGFLPERAPMVLTGVVLETLGPGVTMDGVMGRQIWGMEQWFVHLRGTWLFLWYGVLLATILGFSRWRDRPLLRWLALVPAMQAAAYTAVYAASTVEPQGLQGVAWHITTSLDRLLLQLAPAVFALAAAAWLGAAPTPTMTVKSPAKQPLPPAKKTETGPTGPR
jgi:4-amino-4-deoxy-L-arabinose transferase-like glycosyltransferase